MTPLNVEKRSCHAQSEPVKPNLIVHADWSTNGAKRWMATALLGPNGEYQITRVASVGELRLWFSSLRTLSPPHSSILVGVDFPIGLPAAYAKNAGIDSFPGILPELGRGIWSDFYRIANTSDEISLGRPFYPQNGGQAGDRKKMHLAIGLGVGSYAELLRRCEKKTSSSPEASALFWTLASKQVGRAAISGWRELILPAMELAEENIAIWPFCGSLSSILRPGHIVIAETYPARYYRHLGLNLKLTATGKSGKTSQSTRTLNAPGLMRWASRASATFSDSVISEIHSGFGSSPEGEDKFDALIGLCAMIDVVNGQLPESTPETNDVLKIEGWILGMGI